MKMSINGRNCSTPEFFICDTWSTAYTTLLDIRLVLQSAYKYTGQSIESKNKNIIINLKHVKRARQHRCRCKHKTFIKKRTHTIITNESII